MKVIDVDAGTDTFVRLIIADRVKWVRGSATLVLDKLKIDKVPVSREELIGLIETFGTEGGSPFNPAVRAGALLDEEMNEFWVANNRD